MNCNWYEFHERARRDQIEFVDTSHYIKFHLGNLIRRNPFADQTTTISSKIDPKSFLLRQSWKSLAIRKYRNKWNKCHLKNSIYQKYNRRKRKRINTSVKTQKEKRERRKQKPCESFPISRFTLLCSWFSLKKKKKKLFVRIARA